MVLIKYITTLAIALLAIYGCDTNPSLQSYLVDKQEDNNFVKVDIATSLLQSKDADFTQEEKDILNTVKKINVVAYPIKEDNLNEYEKERTMLKKIIDQDQYKTLMKFGSNARGASLKYLGEEDAIDEIIVFASDSERGFAVFRLIGENMRPDSMLKLMKSIDKGDIDASQLKSIGDLFGASGMIN